MSARDLRVWRHVAEYLIEFRSNDTTPPAPCACGDGVFYRLAQDAPWRCRSCSSPGWRRVPCCHQPPCEAGWHLRSAVSRWHVLPRSTPSTNTPRKEHEP